MKKTTTLAITILSALNAFSVDYYVDASRPDDTGIATSWITAKKNIQAAIALTSDGDTVWVTNGVYNTGGDIAPGYSLMNRVCITNAITVQSVNGPTETLIEGSAGTNGGNDVDSVRGVFMTNNCLLVGFTITNGFTGTWRAPGARNTTGGGVWLTMGCVVSNCHLIGCSSEDSGGGAFCSKGGTFYNSVFGSNSAYASGGGVYCSEGGSFYNCVFENNSSGFSGGGAACFEEGVFYNCVFENNTSLSGGGISLGGNGALYNSEVVSNSSHDGGGISLSQGGEVEGCLIAENYATNKGGGISCFYGGRVVCCTIVKNEADVDGGGMFFDQGGGLLNCIAWGNLKNGLVNNMNYFRLFGVYNTCESEKTPYLTLGCITNNPLFVDSAAGNYHLTLGSPCINAGYNSYVSNLNDLDDNSRIVGGVVDMGAYERQDVGSDVDIDDIADLWEMENFRSRYSADPSATCANGMNTIREAYVAGFDPSDPDDKFTTSIVSENIIQWPCTSGRVYSVYWSTNLLENFQPLETNIPWTCNSFTNSTDTPNAYFKIKVQLEE
jgi:hypothetical protein